MASSAVVAAGPRTLRALAREKLRLPLELATTDLAAQYKRTALGWLWLLLTPLALLGIYTLVFGVFLKVRWTDPGGASVGYSLPMLVGLVIYLFISDLVNSSTTLFTSKRTFVVKSSFPIWMLWLANLLRACMVSGGAFAILLLFALVSGALTWRGLGYAAIALAAAVPCVAAVSLILSVIGPFIGDVSQSVRLGLRLLFYATPITYPLAAVPAPYRDWMWLNPLTAIVEPLRQAIVFGGQPYLMQSVLFFSVSLLALAVGIWMFQRVRGIIADVV
jgi:lipopolysaccharide transport system permease protein